MKNHQKTAEQAIKDEGRNRKTYRKPRLEALGDLRTVTLGGTPGFGDSGAGGGFQSLPGVHTYSPFPPPPGFNNPGGFTQP